MITGKDLVERIQQIPGWEYKLMCVDFDDDFDFVDDITDENDYIAIRYQLELEER